MDKKTFLLLLIFSVALFAAVFSAYSSSMRNEFVWDDRNFIIESPYVHDFSRWRELFTHNVGFSGGARNNFYRPVYSLLNAANFLAGGGQPFAFHLTNAFLHAACAALVMTLFFLVARDALVAFAAALLFAVHPVQTQAVAYIAGRADPLYSLFALLSMVLFTAYRRNRSKKWTYFLSLSAFALALLSKEAAALTPFYIALIAYADREAGRSPERSRLADLMPFFLLLGFYVVMRLTVLDLSKAAHSGLVVPPTAFYARAITACKAVFMYFRFLFYPVGFQMETYLPTARSIAEGASLAAVTGVAVLAGLVYYASKRDKLVFFGLAWYFMGLLPVLNLFPMNANMAVHWLYLPSAGFFFALSLILRRFTDALMSGRGAALRVPVFLAAVLAAGAVLGGLTWRKNAEWRDEETLYKHVLLYSRTPRVYVNLGNIYTRKGDFDNAVKYYMLAKEIAPAQTEIYVNLGYVYIAKRDYPKAEEVLRQAVTISPRHANAHFNLGVTYANMGRFREALLEIEKTLELNPNHTAALNTRGKIYLKQGEAVRAREAFMKSLAVDAGQDDIRKIVETLDSYRERGVL